jgi:hypothetical protein
VKIPKRVNNALDWAENNIRVITIVTVLVVVSGAALWLPALAAFGLGALIGGVVVRWRLVRRLARLRAEADDLLRENGALRHRNTMLSRGVAVSSGQLTQKLPIIPRDDERSQDKVSAQDDERSQDKVSAQDDERSQDKVSAQDNGDSSRTERMSIIPWDHDAPDDGDTPLMGVIRRRH